MIVRLRVLVRSDVRPVSSSENWESHGDDAVRLAEVASQAQDVLAPATPDARALWVVLLDIRRVEFERRVAYVPEAAKSLFRIAGEVVTSHLTAARNGAHIIAAEELEFLDDHGEPLPPEAGLARGVRLRPAARGFVNLR